MIFNPKCECLSQGEKEKLQYEKLLKTLKLAYNNCKFYREKFDAANIKIEDVKSIKDISKLPFTTKGELRETYPYGLLTSPLEDIIEIHTSSGTTGKPVVGAYTEHDIDMWGEAVARCICMAGGDKKSIIQNSYGYGLFTGGLGIHHGAKKLGANVIPISAGNTEKQLQIMRDFGTTTITCTPSYALFLAETAKENNIDLKKTDLKNGLFGAEPWSENMRKAIEKNFNIKAYDIYGLTEIVGPGVACECEEQNGLHVNEDFFYPEIIDPQTGEVLEEGKKGELVFTTIDKTGSPIIRYRTRDITYMFRDKCKCGRTTVKIARLMGRNDDMMIIRGVNVFPSQIEEILIEIEETMPHYLIILERDGSLDSIEIQVEVNESFFSDETKKLEDIRAKIKEKIKSRLLINAKITLVEPKTINRSIGKANRIIDKRKI